MTILTETALMIVMTINGANAEEIRVDKVAIETCLTAREQFIKAEELKIDLPKNIKVECFVEETS